MRKIVILVLCAIMLFSFAACGSTDTSSTTADSNTKNPAINVEDREEDKDAQKVPEEPEKPDEAEIIFEEVVVVDNEECTIKIVDINPDALFGYSVKAYFENKSADKTYMYSVVSAAVDGIESDPFFATEVAAGKKANSDILFSDSHLKENGIEFTDIQLSFRVYDSDDWMAEPVAEEMIHIYPYGEEKAVSFIREPQDTDTVIVDNDNVTIIVTGYEDDDIWGYTVNLYYVNKTDTEVMFSVDEVSVNGYMADPFYAKSVIPGKCAFSSMSWSKTTLEENGITDIENIEFTLRAYDSNSWGSSDFFNEVVVLEP